MGNARTIGVATVLVFCLSATLDVVAFDFGGIREKARSLGERARESRDRAKEKAEEALDRARERARESLDRSRERAGNAVNDARKAADQKLQHAGESVQRAKENASDAIRSRTRNALEGGVANTATVSERASAEERQWREKSESFRWSLMAKVNDAFAIRQDAWRQRQDASRAACQRMKDRWLAGRPAREAKVRALAERAARVSNGNSEGSGRAIERAVRAYGPRAAAALVSAYERHGAGVGDFAAAALERHAPEISSAVRDPHDAEKVACAVIAVARLKCEWKDVKMAASYAALRAVGRLEVDTRDGRKTIEGLSRDWMLEKAPFLENSSIVEDPAEFVVYGLVYRDKDYLFSEMRVLDSRKGDGKVSLKTALVEAAPADAEEALRVLALMEGCETLGGDLEEGTDPRLSADAFRRGVDSYNSQH